jgi:uncharacterized protein YigE (DUF2233 family)
MQNTRLMTFVSTLAGSILLLFMYSLPAQAQTQWEWLQPGLAYTVIPIESSNSLGKLHAFRFDLQDYQLQLTLAQDIDRKAASIHQLARSQNALLAINGGFFTPDRQLLGLRIQDSVEVSPLKKTSWWGVFYIKNNKPHIVAQRQYRSSQHIELAVQSGPRLVINGRIPSLKPGLAERSVICIDPQQRVILAATQHAPISTTDLAEILHKSAQRDGLGCENALNLDGGHSTQLFADIDKFRLNITGFSAITDALVVSPKDTNS